MTIHVPARLKQYLRHIACCVVLGAGIAAPSMAQVDPFQCGGSIEAETWTTWDRNVSGPFLQTQLQDRLLKQRDTYALYDIQIYTHNLWSMAARCKRPERLRELAGIVSTAYQALQAAPSRKFGRAWVCRGGAICRDNKLLNTEVKLASFQFLGLASFAANALSTSGIPLSDDDAAFINQTAEVIDEHLLRWADDYQVNRLQRTSNARPQEIPFNDSFLLFSDIDLWHLTVYAELAGVRQWQRLRGVPSSLNAMQEARVTNYLKTLLQTFRARTTIQQPAAARLAADMADVDRGYWGRMPANTYAGYDGVEKPLTCSPVPQVRIPSNAIVQRTDTGWDLSHARRLVQALDALERNRIAMQAAYSIDETLLPPRGLADAFATTLVNTVWNGDTVRPLFSNYWSGANGWFGASFSAASGECSEGMAPWSMTDTFPTGGFITWARYRPLIGILGRQLYTLVNSPASEDAAFVQTFYPTLSSKAPSEYRSLYMTMFLSSLVGIAPG